MKQAKIKVNVIVEIKDEVEKPGGGKIAPIRVHTRFKSTVKDLIKEAKDRYSEGFDGLLSSYVDLCILEIAGVPFTPLTTEVALKLEDCEIEEVKNNARNTR